MATYSTLTAPQPLISSFALSNATLLHRTEVAEDKAEALNVKHNKPDGRYGREILWHPLFAQEFQALLGSTPLYEVSAFLETSPFWEEGQLDLVDYGYLADVLREGLADNPTPLAALRLSRALAWIEQKGGARE